MNSHKKAHPLSPKVYGVTWREEAPEARRGRQLGMRFWILGKETLHCLTSGQDGRDEVSVTP